MRDNAVKESAKRDSGLKETKDSSRLQKKVDYLEEKVNKLKQELARKEKMEKNKEWFDERIMKFNMGLKSIQEYYNHPMLNSKLGEDEQQTVESILDLFLRKFMN